MKRRKPSNPSQDVIPLELAGGNSAQPASSAYQPAGSTSHHPTAEYGFSPPRFPGDIGFFGRYRILKVLGSGGMGAVFLAIDSRLERQVALKVIKPEHARDEVMHARFLREGRAVAKVSHDNVISILDTDVVQGVPIIAMPFLKGCSLEDFLRRTRPSVAQCMRIVREVALGLSAAHELGLIHRDIKPGNIWLEAPKGRVKILDFGLAKINGSEGPDKNLTKSGSFMGTPLYTSLEQALGRTLDHRTDLFSLGAVLYRMLAGKAPFDRPGGYNEIMVALATEEAAPIQLMNPDVPDSLSQLTHDLLAKEPNNRPQSAAEIAERLRRMMQKFAVEHQSQTASVIPIVKPIQPGTKPAPVVKPTDSTVDSEADIETLGEIKSGLDVNSEIRGLVGGTEPGQGILGKLFTHGFPTVVIGLVALFAILAGTKTYLLPMAANFAAILFVVPLALTFWLRKVTDNPAGLSNVSCPLQRAFWRRRRIIGLFLILPLSAMLGYISTNSQFVWIRTVGAIVVAFTVVPLVAAWCTLRISHKHAADRIGGILQTAFASFLCAALFGGWTAFGADVAIRGGTPEFLGMTLAACASSGIVGFCYGAISAVWSLLLNRNPLVVEAT